MRRDSEDSYFNDDDDDEEEESGYSNVNGNGIATDDPDDATDDVTDDTETESIDQELIDENGVEYSESGSETYNSHDHSILFEDRLKAHSGFDDERLKTDSGFENGILDRSASFSSARENHVPDGEVREEEAKGEHFESLESK